MRYVDPPAIRNKREKVRKYYDIKWPEVTLSSDAPDYIRELDKEFQEYDKKRDELEMNLMGAPE